MRVRVSPSPQSVVRAGGAAAAPPQEEPQGPPPRTEVPPPLDEGDAQAGEAGARLRSLGVIL